MASKNGLVLLALAAGAAVLLLSSDSKASGPEKCEWESNLPELDKQKLTQLITASGTDQPGGGAIPAELDARMQAYIGDLKARGYPKAARCFQVLYDDAKARSEGSKIL